MVERNRFVMDAFSVRIYSIVHAKIYIKLLNQILFQDYDQKFARKSMFLEELHLCSKFVENASSKSCFGKLCQLTSVQRRIKKMLLKVPFTSPAGQLLIKYSKLISKNTCASTNRRTLRSDAENTPINTGDTKLNESKLLENRFYSFSRHPLSKNNSQTTYLAFNAGEMNMCNECSIKLRRFTAANIAAINRRLKVDMEMTYRNDNRCSQYYRSLIPILGNGQKTVSVQVKRLNSEDIEAFNRRLMKDYTIQCSTVTVDIKRLKSDAVEAIQLRFKLCKRVTVKLTSIVSKHYTPNSWLRAYYR